MSSLTLVGNVEAVANSAQSKPMRLSLQNHAGLLLLTIVLLNPWVLARSPRPAQAQPRPTVVHSPIVPPLSSLPRPVGTLGQPQPSFHAASFGQTMLNFQATIDAPDTETMAQQVVGFYRCELAGTGCQKVGLGYREQAITTIVAQWGFSLVFEPPAHLNLTPKDPTKRVVLVLQGVVLSPQTININLRYEEL